MQKLLKVSAIALSLQTTFSTEGHAASFNITENVLGVVQNASDDIEKGLSAGKSFGKAATGKIISIVEGTKAMYDIIAANRDHRNIQKDRLPTYEEANRVASTGGNSLATLTGMSGGEKQAARFFSDFGIRQIASAKVQSCRSHDYSCISKSLAEVDKATEIANHTFEMKIEKVKLESKVILSNPEEKKYSDPESETPPTDAVECGTMEHYSKVGDLGCGTVNEERSQVSNEGFNGVWRQASAGQDGMLLQVTDDNFTLKLGQGMEACGTISGTFSLRTADEIVGSFNGQCADLNMQGNVGMQRSGDDYTLTNCVSMATGTPDSCSLGYFATAERVTGVDAQ